MSVFSQIADAVVEDLNQGAFSQTFTAVRACRPVVELADLKTLHVTVVPKAATAEIVSKTIQEHEKQIDVSVQKRVDPSDLDECDALDLLCEEIADYFSARTVGSDLAICNQVQREPIYDPEHMDQKRVFTGLITLTFRHYF